ncbi:MAG: glutathione peroxidase [Alphaproteobacteria bacterium]
MNAHDIMFETIDGAPLPLGGFAGKAILVVNTASECGFTPQYKDLEALWRRYRDQGLVVLGVPSNDFGGQEPGDERDIASFCDQTYGVTFPLTRKVSVIGPGAHPFYKAVAAELGQEALPRWNFHKFLIGRDGALADSFPSKVAPLSKDLLAAVEAALKR